jgi:hypothetical protein
MGTQTRPGLARPSGCRNRNTRHVGRRVQEETHSPRRGRGGEQVRLKPAVRLIAAQHGPTDVEAVPNPVHRPFHDSGDLFVAEPGYRHPSTPNTAPPEMRPARPRFDLDLDRDPSSQVLELGQPQHAHRPVRIRLLGRADQVPPTGSCSAASYWELMAYGFRTGLTQLFESRIIGTVPMDRDQRLREFL